MTEEEITVWCNDGPHHGDTLKLRGPLPPHIRLAIRSGSALDGLTDCVEPVPTRVATYARYKDTKRYDWVKR